MHVDIDVRKAHHIGSYWEGNACNWWKGHPWYIVSVKGWKIDHKIGNARYCEIARFEGEMLRIDEQNRTMDIFDKGYTVGHIANIDSISWSKKGVPLDVDFTDTQITISKANMKTTKERKR